MAFLRSAFGTDSVQKELVHVVQAFTRECKVSRRPAVETVQYGLGHVQFAWRIEKSILVCCRHVDWVRHTC